ncbi:MAG TPA: hypothetical protein VHD87_06300 [Acidimicrobiales bacterium]|nr:hypothetical protein [Acidimicrobiales bacterium]HVV35107.1 hypothetical protein [Acidimicrobiales bacterium]
MDQAFVLALVVFAGALVGTIAGRLLKAHEPQREVLVLPDPEALHVDLERLLAMYDAPAHA